MSRRKQNRNKGATTIGEEVRIAVNLTIKKFLATEEQKELEFTSAFTAEQRAFIHNLAADLGLKSKSRGKGANRYLTVYKREGSTIVQADAVFHLARSSRTHIFGLVHKFPLTNKERQELLPHTERDRLLNAEVPLPAREVHLSKLHGRLIGACPFVPSHSVNPEVVQFRQSLPVSNMKEEIVQAINSHQVVLICGDTGSGKTTQIPQFIVEHCASTGRACRIICTQPRRISALSVAERVAYERDEKVGTNVGYQIHLESRVSPKTFLTYCTEGVILRTLMGGDATLATITHVFVDEIHERNRFTDFLLIILRDTLAKFRSLRLILMSATVDASTFAKYFNNCPVITVPGRLFEVKEYFLEDILKMTKYTSKQMVQARKELKEKKERQAILEKWTKSVVVQSCKEEDRKDQKDRKDHVEYHSPVLGQFTEVVPERAELDEWTVKEMDRCLAEAWLNGSDDAFAQLIHLIFSENVSVDYQHTQTAVTPLMVAAGRGCLNTVEQLLNLGANTFLRASNDWSAVDWARKMNHTEIAELLEAYMHSEPTNLDPQPIIDNNELDESDRELLDIYHHSFCDDNIDIDLLLKLLIDIHSNFERGAILVFVSGYDDIVMIRERILNEDKRFNEAGKYVLYLLHSTMQTTDQKKAFRPAPPGVRKIILATNIAETSITIDDVVYVVDCGKSKQKSFDAISGVCMLQSQWISQTSAKQRAGRAGRTQPGICFHLFSSIRYKLLQEHATPEILRLPLQELCLHTKQLAPPNTPIADFLARAIDPPSFVVTRNAVQLLKTIDALDAWEDVTELGNHLMDLPLDPRLGKMVLYSVVLKCLDPVLTIACTLSYKDPFLLPNQPSLRRAVQLIRKKFSSGSYSDHMAYLRVFQLWQHARGNGWERSFCEKNFISLPAMEMVLGTRIQVLTQLRASGFLRSRNGQEIRELNMNSENWAVVKAALCAGMYPNLIRVDREHMQLRTQKEHKVVFHPSSTLRDCLKATKASMAQSHAACVEDLPADWLIYEEMSRSGRFCHARCCTVVSPITVALFAGPARMPLEAVAEADVYRGESAVEAESDSEVEDRPDGQTTTLKLDDWVVFRVDPEAAHLALQLRQKWHALFLRRMRFPARPNSQVDELTLKTIVSVLTAEEQHLGLQQPMGIGQRPRLAGVGCLTYANSNTALLSEEPAETRPRKAETVGKSDMERSESSSMKSFGSGNVSGTSSPTPSQSSAGEAAVNRDAGDTRYFIIKAASMKTIEGSLSKGIWAFTVHTERKILRAFKEAKNIILVFSVQGSGHFQGYARLVSDKQDSRYLYVDEVASPNLCIPYPVEWIKRANIPFQATRHLTNPYNENRRVQTSRDGQEIEPAVGEELCELWDRVQPFVPKSAYFPPKEMLEQPRSRYHGRAIRGYNYGNNYNPAYQPHFYQHPK